MAQSPIVIPTYLDKLKGEKHQIERNRFLIKLAALYIQPAGTVSHLSKALGLSRPTLHAMINRPFPLEPKWCVKIENLVGRAVMPREVLNPAMFQLPS